MAYLIAADYTLYYGRESNCVMGNHIAQERVDSGRGQDRTLRGMAPVERAIDGWS